MDEIDLDEVVICVLLGNISELQSYLDYGMPFDVRTETDRKSLLHCAMNRNTGTTPLPMIEFLLKLGLEPNARDRDNWTPLHYAARSHAVKGAKRLLEAGAEIDSEDDEGMTPLLRHLQTMPLSKEMITLFLSHGADPDRNDGRIRKFVETCRSPDREWILNQFNLRRTM